MTEPTLPPTTPILNAATLGRWAQESPLSDPDFAEIVLGAIDRLLRFYGDPYWTAENIPGRALDIAYFTARNYYLNPDLIRQESTGPIQETRDNQAQQGIAFNESQIAEIRGLATADDGVGGDDLWLLSTTRGPLETSQPRGAGNTVVYDTRAAWPIEYLTAEQSVVFLPEE